MVIQEEDAGNRRCGLQFSMEEKEIAIEKRIDSAVEREEEIL